MDVSHFFQENKDVVQYLVLPQAWGGDFVHVCRVLGSPCIGMHIHIHTRFYKGDEKVLSTVAATHSSPVGAAAPLLTLGRSHRDRAPSKPSLQVATPVDISSTKETFLCHQSIPCSGFNRCQRLFLKWNWASFGALMGSSQSGCGLWVWGCGTGPPFSCSGVVLSLLEGKICFKHLPKPSRPLQNALLRGQSAGRTPGAGAGPPGCPWGRLGLGATTG